MTPAHPALEPKDGAPGRHRRPRSPDDVLRALWLVVLIALLAMFGTRIGDSYDVLRFGTIGILLEPDGHGRIVLTPIPGQAAAQAGLHAGDVLLAIDGAHVAVGTTPPDLRRQLRDAAGVPVRLTVARSDGASLDLIIERTHPGSARLGISPTAYAATLIAVGVLFVVAYAVPAALIALRRPRDLTAALVWLTLMLVAIFNSRASIAIRISDGPIGPAVSAAYHLAVLLVMLTFPDGRLVPRWTRWYLPVGMAWIAIKLLPLPGAQALQTTPYWVLIDFLVFGIAVAAQVARFRTATDPAARQQTKWLVYGFVAAFLVQYAYHIPHEIVTAFRGRSPFEFAGSVVNHVLMLILPIAFGHAVLRHRLYDIDVVINRTLVYVPLTAILAGVYAASVPIFRNLAAELTGEATGAASLLSTIIVVALLTPVRNRLQKAVDERFRYASRADRALKDFELQVRDRLQAIQPGPAIRRFLDHAIRGYDALGGAAELVDADAVRQLCTAGTWSGEAMVSVPIGSGERTYGRIALGARRGGAGYGSADLERLRATAAVVAAALEEDRLL